VTCDIRVFLFRNASKQREREKSDSLFTKHMSTKEELVEEQLQLQRKKDVFYETNSSSCPNGKCTNKACGFYGCVCGEKCSCNRIVNEDEEVVTCDPCKDANAKKKQKEIA
jgi:hypothetical protein